MQRHPIVLLALLCASATAVSAQCHGFAGTWSTSYGEMRLTRSGATVTGSYGGDKQLVGRVDGSVLTGEWTYPSGRRGTLRFVLGTNAGSFSGAWSEPGGRQSVGWSGTCESPASSAGGGGAPPAPPGPGGSCGDWSGTWSTSYGTMTLTRTGNTVTGNYGSGRTISGRVTGAALEGTWRYPSGRSGAFRWTLSPGGGFAGHWWEGAGSSPTAWSGTCTSRGGGSRGPGGCSAAGVTCPGPGGVGACADPGVLAAMDEWLDLAVPTSGGCYDCWGRWIGTNDHGVIATVNQNPDTDGRTRCEYLWYLAPQLGSKNGVGTMADRLRARGYAR